MGVIEQEIARHRSDQKRFPSGCCHTKICNYFRQEREFGLSGQIERRYHHINT